MPKYGDKTAEKLDNYMKNYTMPERGYKNWISCPV